MNPEPRRNTEELYRSALRQAPELRQAFLNEACGGDPELRRQVEMLLTKESQRSSDTAAETVTASMLNRQLGPVPDRGQFGRRRHGRGVPRRR